MKTKPALLLLTATASLLGVLAFAAEHKPPADHAAEMKTFHAKALATYDVDKNGKLDQDERAVLHDDVRSGKFPIPAAVRQHLTQAVMNHGDLPAEILARYDTNKDGKLDEKEHVAFAADILAGNVQPPHPRHAAPHHAPDGKKAAPRS
jgi:hypothetical protein